MYVHIIKLFYGSFVYDCHEFYQEYSVIIEAMKGDLSTGRHHLDASLGTRMPVSVKNRLKAWIKISIYSGRSQTAIQLCQVATLHAIFPGSSPPNARRQTRHWLESVPNTHRSLQVRPIGWLWSRFQPQIAVLFTVNFFYRKWPSVRYNERNSLRGPQNSFVISRTNI